MTLNVILVYLDSRSNSKIKVTARSSRSQEENIDKAVGATSSNGFFYSWVLLLSSISWALCSVRSLTQRKH